MNLSGFCAADPAVCGAPPSGAATVAAAMNSPYASQARALADAVSNALYRVAAAVGREVICPALPIAGAVLAGAIGSYFLPEETIVLGPAAIEADRLAAELGREAGAKARRQLCGY